MKRDAMNKICVAQLSLINIFYFCFSYRWSSIFRPWSITCDTWDCHNPRTFSFYISLRVAPTQKSSQEEEQTGNRGALRDSRRHWRPQPCRRKGRASDRPFINERTDRKSLYCMMVGSSRCSIV